MEKRAGLFMTHLKPLVLKHSWNKTDLFTALKEWELVWYGLGKEFVYESWMPPISHTQQQSIQSDRISCLCTKHDLSYIAIIYNTHTKKVMCPIGSDCIERFPNCRLKDDAGVWQWGDRKIRFKDTKYDQWGYKNVLVEDPQHRFTYGNTTTNLYNQYRDVVMRRRDRQALEARRTIHKYVMKYFVEPKKDACVRCNERYYPVMSRRLCRQCHKKLEVLKALGGRKMICPYDYTKYKSEPPQYHNLTQREYYCIAPKVKPGEERKSPMWSNFYYYSKLKHDFDNKLDLKK